jgi:hypothetical protein
MAIGPPVRIDMMAMKNAQVDAPPSCVSFLSQSRLHSVRVGSLQCVCRWQRFDR